MIGIFLKLIGFPLIYHKITDYKRWIIRIYSILINSFMLITVIMVAYLPVLLNDVMILIFDIRNFYVFILNLGRNKRINQLLNR
jgi:hypothetical protein